MTDDLTEAFRNLALALDPDLVADAPTPALWAWVISNDKGLVVHAQTELEAWTLALEAAKKRLAWRASKAEKRIERIEGRRPGWTPIGRTDGRPSLLVVDDDGGDAA